MAKGYNLTVQINLQGPKNLNSVVGNINKQLNNVTANVKVKVPPKVAQQLNTLNRNMRNVSKNAQTATNSMEKFGKSAGLAIKRFGAFTAATAGFYAITRATSQSLEKFIEFDRQITRIAQVTGATRQSLGGLSNEITNLSTNLGVSSQELAKVSVVLSQAGLSAANTEKALRALALTTLAPTFNDINQTVEGSIALMKQFSISTRELEGALGSINAVAGQFAVEANDIITAIQRTGGVFAAASNGVSQGTDALNEFIAVFTSVRATTRESAETIATGLRTIFTRIQREDTLESLKQFGITLTDLEGKFIGPFRAIERLSEGLRNLDPRDVQFSSIVEDLGGFRQVGKVIPLIQQFTTAQNALNVAQQGSGSLAKDAALGQQSLGVQIAKVGEEFNALVRSIGQTSEFKQFISLSLDLASALISIGDAVKPLLPALAALGAISIGKNIGNFAKGFKGSLGFNKGGLVRGPGGIDKVGPISLTNGEYVIRDKAVSALGVGTLEQINKTGKLPGFNKGGMVDASALPSAEIRKRVTRTGRKPEYGAGSRVNAGDKVKVDIRSLAFDAGKIGDKEFETAVAKQTGGRTASSKIAAVDVVSPGYGPIEVRNRQEFTPDNILADKLARYKLGTIGEAALANQMQHDTIDLGRMYVAYNTGKLSEEANKKIKDKGKKVTKISGVDKKNRGGYGKDNIQALLTEGEYVLREEAARKLGPETLRQLNNADKLPGFNKGGYVGTVRRFKGGAGGQQIGPSGGGGGLGGLGIMFALQGAASFFASTVEKSGSDFGAQVGGAVQGLVGGVGAGAVAGQLAGTVKGLSAMSGTIGIATGVVVGIVGAFNGAINASRKFALELNNQKIKQATESLSGALERVAQNANDIGARRDVATNVDRASRGILGNRNIENTRPQAMLMNFGETLASFLGGAGTEAQQRAAAERAFILELKGVSAYFSTLGGEGGDERRKELIKPIREQQAFDDAQQFKPIVDSAIKLFEEQIKSGESISDIVNSSSFKQFDDALARVNPKIALQIAELEANTSISKQERESRIAAIVAQEAATQATVRTAALRSQLEIEAAQKQGRTLETVLNRIFANVNQSLSATAYNVSRAFEDIELDIAAASGRPEVGFDDSKLITVLENSQAFTVKEVTAAVRSITPMLGDQGDSIGTMAIASTQLEGQVLAAINRAVKNPDNTTDEATAAAVRRELQDIVANLNLPPDVANILGRQITAGIKELRSKGKDQVGLDTTDVRESVQGFAGTVDSLKGANEVIINALKTYNDALQKYTSVTNKLVDIRVKRDQLLRTSVDVLRNGLNTLAKAFGRTASLQQVDRDVRTRTAAQTGGADDPVEILENINKLQSRRRTLQDARETVSRDPTNLEQLRIFDNQLIETNAALQNNVNALQALANNTDLANAALSKISEVQQQRESQAGFLEKLVSSTPEQVSSLNSAFSTIERAMQGQATTINDSVAAQIAYSNTLAETGNVLQARQAAQGALAENRGNALGLAKEIAAFLPKNEANTMRADLLQQFLRETGNLTPQFREVVNAIRNPERDPEVQVARQFYNDSINRQSEANRALAIIQENLAAQLQTSSANAIATAISGTILRVNVQNTADIARGIQPIQVQTKADGGTIYAAQGQQVGFQPRGTDTVPAMLTPGEFVVNRQAASRNMGILNNINSGKTSYYAAGGFVGPYRSDRFKENDSVVAKDKFVPIEYWKNLPPPLVSSDTYQTATSAMYPPSSNTNISNEQIRDAGGVNGISNLIRSTFYRGAGNAIAGRSQNLSVALGGKNSNIKSTIDNAIKNLKDKDGNNLNLTKDDFVDIKREYVASPGLISYGGTGGPIPFDAKTLKRGEQLNQLVKATKLPYKVLSDYLLGDFIPEDYLIGHFAPDNSSFTRPIAPAELRLAAWGEAGTMAAMQSRDNVRFKDIQDYAKTFYRNTSHVTSPDGSIIDKITPLNQVSGGVEGGGNVLSLNSVERGLFGLFKTSNSAPTDIDPTIGVDRNVDGSNIKLAVGPSHGNYSKDRGKQLLAGDMSEAAKNSVELSSQIYNEVERTRQRLAGGQRPDLSQAASKFISELNTIYSNKDLFVKFSDPAQFLENPTAFGLSAEGKRKYNNPAQNIVADDFLVGLRGGRKNLGLVDDATSLAEEQQAKEEVRQKRLIQKSSGKDIPVRVDFPVPNDFRRNNPQLRLPRTVPIGSSIAGSRYSGVFFDDANKRPRSQFLQGVRQFETGILRAFIPQMSHLFGGDANQAKSFLHGSGDADGFTLRPESYQKDFLNAIRSSAPDISNFLFKDGAMPDNIEALFGAGSLFGSKEASAKMFASVRRVKQRYNISGAIQESLNLAKEDFKTRGADLSDLAPKAGGGKNLAAKFNDMLSDTRMFFGNTVNLGGIQQANTDQEALNAAAQAQGALSNPVANEVVSRALNGFFQAFKRLDSTVIDAYTRNGNVATVRLANDLAVSDFMSNAGNTDAAGQAFIQKVFGAGYDKLNSGGIAAGVQTPGDVYDQLMNPQRIFPDRKGRSFGIRKIIENLIDFGVYPQSSDKGLPTARSATNAVGELGRWYAGWQDAYAAPIKSLGNDEENNDEKKKLWARAIESYRSIFGGVRGTANSAHYLLGGAKHGPLLNLAQFGALVDAPILDKPKRFQTGGVVYANNGMQVPQSMKQGTDTVPAMLTPGEFVVNAKAARKNRGLLHSINNGSSSGRTHTKNGVLYAEGGEDTNPAPLPNSSETPRQMFEANVTAALREFDFESHANALYQQYYQYAKANYGMGHQRVIPLAMRGAAKRQAIMDTFRARNNIIMQAAHEAGYYPNQRKPVQKQAPKYNDEYKQRTRKKVKEALARAREEKKAREEEKRQAEEAKQQGDKGATDTPEPIGPVPPKPVAQPKPVVTEEKETKGPPSSSTIAEYNKQAAARRKARREKQDRERQEREKELRDIQADIDGGNARKAESGYYTQEAHDAEMERRRKEGYDPGLSLQDVQREDVLRENLNKQKKLEEKQREDTIKMNREQNRKGKAQQPEGTTATTKGLLTVGDVFNIGAQYIEGTIRTGVGLAAKGVEGMASLNPLSGGTGARDDDVFKSRSQAEIEHGAALSRAATERLSTLGEGGVDPRKRPHQQHLDEIKAEKRHTAEELGVGTPVAMAEGLTETASQFLAPGMPLVKGGGAARKGGKKLGALVAEVKPTKPTKLSPAMQAQIEASMKEAEKAGVSIRETVEDVAAHQMTPGHLTNELQRRTRAAQQKALKASQEVQPGGEIGQGMTAAQTAKIPSAGAPKPTAITKTDLADVVEVKKAQPKPKVEADTTSAGTKPKSKTQEELANQEIDFSSIGEAEVNRLAREQINKIKNKTKAKIEADELKQTRQIEAQRNKRNPTNRDASELTPSEQPVPVSEAASPRPTVSSKPKPPGTNRVPAGRPKLTDTQQFHRENIGYRAQSGKAQKFDDMPETQGIDRPLNAQQIAYRKQAQMMDENFKQLEDFRTYEMGRGAGQGATTVPGVQGPMTSPQVRTRLQDIGTKELKGQPNRFTVDQEKGIMQIFGNDPSGRLNTILYEVPMSMIKNSEALFQSLSQKGIQRFNKGGSVLVDYAPQGTDTVPAMLTPGEFVVNKKATQKNLGLLKAINKSSGGQIKNGVLYAEKGAGPIGGVPSTITLNDNSGGASAGTGIDGTLLNSAATALLQSSSSLNTASQNLSSSNSGDLASLSSPAAITAPAPETGAQQNAPQPINLEAITAAGTAIQQASNSLSTGLTALGQVRFGVIKVGADTFGNKVADFNTHVGKFNRVVDRFGEIIGGTTSLISAINSLQQGVNGTITVNGSLSVPDQINLNLEGLDIAGELEGFRQGILAQVARTIAINNPTFDVDDITGSA